MIKKPKNIVSRKNVLWCLFIFSALLVFFNALPNIKKGVDVVWAAQTTKIEWLGYIQYGYDVPDVDRPITHTQTNIRIGLRDDGVVVWKLGN